MRKPKTVRTKRSLTVSTLLNEIKDEIDSLHDIKSPKRRAEAARDLVEYIQLHHLDGV